MFSVISMLEDMELTNDEIAQKIAQVFSLSQEEAKEIIEQ